MQKEISGIEFASILANPALYRASFTVEIDGEKHWLAAHKIKAGTKLAVFDIYKLCVLDDEKLGAIVHSATTIMLEYEIDIECEIRRRVNIISDFMDGSTDVKVGKDSYQMNGSAAVMVNYDCDCQINLIEFIKLAFDLDLIVERI